MNVFPEKAKQHISLLIVGGGPIGLACALEAKARGIPSLVIEKGTLTNSIYHYPVNMTFFSTSERLEIGGVPFISASSKPTRSEALEYYRRVAADARLPLRLFEKVESIRQEHPSATEGSQPVYLVTTNKGSFTADFIIIATGFYDIPYKLEVPGEELPKVHHYFRDGSFYAFQKVLVVGAQNSAVDAALETWRKGAAVTMVVRGNEIGQRVKYWVRPDIINRIEEGSIRAYFNSTLERIEEDKVVLQTPNGSISLENDWVIAMTGYQPNLDFLRKVGIELDKDDTCRPLIDEQTHETSQRNIFLAGVICGGMNTHRLFIENSREHATSILETIAARYR